MEAMSSRGREKRKKKNGKGNLKKIRKGAGKGNRGTKLKKKGERAGLLEGHKKECKG